MEFLVIFMNETAVPPSIYSVPEEKVQKSDFDIRQFSIFGKKKVLICLFGVLK